MRSITVELYKPGKGTTIAYQGELLSQTAERVLLLAYWERPTIDLGYVVFATGDRFYEYYYTEHWYNICEIRDPADQLKGWYCNVTRPAQFDGTTLISEDLELDLFVSPDRGTILRLDRDEFEARGFAQSDPGTYTAALAALDELEQLARVGAPPFGSRLESIT
jgi:predicted RNA-binding protein associated with RNAse of E/G family